VTGISIAAGDLLKQRPVVEAFRALRLDPDRSGDWERLIVHLCTERFGNHRRRGRTAIWHVDKLCQLAADFARAKAAHPDKTDEAVRKLLVRRKDFRDRYGNITHETIRRRLPEGRKELAWVIAEFKRYVQSDLKLSCLTPEQEKQIEDWTVEKYSTMTDPSIFVMPVEEIEAALGGK
jgi:hypothetical protein